MAEVQRIRDLANSEMNAMRTQTAKLAAEEMMEVKADLVRQAHNAIQTVQMSSAAASATALERAKAQLLDAKYEYASQARSAIAEAVASAAASSAATANADHRLDTMLASFQAQSGQAMLLVAERMNTQMQNYEQAAKEAASVKEQMAAAEMSEMRDVMVALQRRAVEAEARLIVFKDQSS